MGRTLTTDKRGEVVRDRYEIVDPPCSQFNPQTDINDTASEVVRMLSPVAENEDGRMDMSPPFNLPTPRSLVLGMTERERTRTVRNDDREDY